MSLFERYLTLWVALCIVAGIALGYVMPGFFQAVGEAEVAKVNLPVAVLIWLMVIPMLLKIDFASLRYVGRHWRGIGVTLFINWAVSRSQWPRSAGCSSAIFFGPTCPPTRSTATSPGSSSWRRPPAPPWCSSGRT
ncbi:Hypothetical protein MexAM1_META2p0146 (plasmid) [Methylorubrum extorquens AM1]|uniref:Arsenical-resistance protein n=1 Tax=Methylorubrum extorquens (strain ATCC 14718 / DSM 1338 / JCM 2805 / NCIMB 9133 / AM1) TaxID=272630 RepID=C5B3N9_METEA|nr:Hypothetical protein MexAM1_META2p0146 [Methylorubrum extorquens AM1]